MRGVSLVFISVLLVMASLAGIGWPVTLVVGSSLLLFIYLDYVLSRGYEDVVDSLVVERRLSRERVREGDVVEVYIKVRDVLGYGVPRLEVVDHVPSRVKVLGKNSGLLYIGRGGEAVLSYKVKPCFGTITFNKIDLVSRDLFGLFGYRKTVTVPCVLRVTPVYTGVKEFFTRSSYYVSGVSSSKRRGLGYEFFELREYQPGDDYRRIVWTAVARTGKLIVREDEAEVQLKTVLFLDLSEDTWTGPECCSGADYIAKTALALTELFSRRNDVVGYTIFYGDKWVTRSPSRAVDTLEKLLIDLSMVSREEVSGRNSFSEALYSTLSYVDQGLLIVLSSWGFCREEVVRDFIEAYSRRPRDTVVLAIMPVEEGVGELETLWRIEKIYYDLYGNRFSRLGIPLFTAKNWGQVAGFLKFIEEVRVRSGF